MAPQLFKGKITCPACGHKNRSDGRFCANCGESLPQNMAPKVDQHRWSKGPNDFAVSIETDDLRGILRKGLIVEPGVNALIIQRGEVQGTVAPGTYILERVENKAWDWFHTGIPDQATALLVDVTPTDIDFHLGGRFTKDPLPIGVNIKLRVSVTEPGRFLVNVLKGRERMSIEDLQQYLYPEIVDVTDGWLRQHELRELIDDPSKRDELELAIEDALDRVFRQSGLNFDHIRTVELNLEPYDEVKGVRGEQKILILKSEAELDLEATESEIKIKREQASLEARERLSKIENEMDIQSLVEETRKVEQQERKVELYQRMREATLSNRMNEVRTERDFQEFMDELDDDKLLKEKEREDLQRTWAEEKEDHQKARAHMLAKIDIEQAFERRLVALQLKSNMDQEELEAETKLARIRADKQMEIEYARWQFELRRRRESMQITQEEEEQALKIQRMQREEARLARQEDTEDEAARLRMQIEMAQQALQGMKDIRWQEAQRKWSLEKERLERKLVQKEKEAELEMASERMKAELELQRLDKLADLGVEALISISPNDQARILADLKKTEAMKGMTEDQILAMAAKDSPEVARALSEKFKAAAEGKMNAETKALYERLLVQKQESLETLQAESEKRVQDTARAWETSSAQSKETIERALDRMSDTAQAFAQNQGNNSQPVIINNPGVGPQVITPGAPGGQVVSGSPASMKICPTCGRSVPVLSKFCEHCGKKFAGMD